MTRKMKKIQKMEKILKNDTKDEKDNTKDEKDKMINEKDRTKDEIFEYDPHKMAEIGKR